MLLLHPNDCSKKKKKEEDILLSGALNKHCKASDIYFDSSTRKTDRKREREGGREERRKGLSTPGSEAVERSTALLNTQLVRTIRCL